MPVFLPPARATSRDRPRKFCKYTSMEVHLHYATHGSILALTARVAEGLAFRNPLYRFDPTGLHNRTIDTSGRAALDVWLLD